MTIDNTSRHRLWSTLLEHVRDTDPPLTCVIALLADIRHWCDRQGESHEAVQHAALELYLIDITTARRRRP